MTTHTSLMASPTFATTYSSVQLKTYSPTPSTTTSPTSSPIYLSIHLSEHNYNGATFAILILDIILTTVAVVGRIASRRMMKAPLSIDDLLTYIAFFSNFGLLICGLALVSYGAVNSSLASIIKNKDQHEMLAAYFALDVLYVITITLVKLSILFLYKRIFTLLDTWFRRTWWLLLNLTLVWAVVCVILLAIQGAHNTTKTGFSRLGVGITGLISAISEIIMLSLPVITIFQMNIHKKQKIALLSVFAIGALALVVSMIRATIFLANNGHMLTRAYSSYLDIVLTATESSAGLMCACLPLIKPLIKGFNQWSRKIRGKRTDNHGWTTLVDSQNSTYKEKDRESNAETPDPIQMRPMQSAYLNPSRKTRYYEAPVPKSAFD